jgi:hypothetical protein
MADTEVFLERFPVNEAELQQLLTLNSQYALLEGQAPVESLALLLKEAYISSNKDDLDLHILRVERLVAVEEKWSLTELAHMFQKALQTVFVVGFPEPEDNPSLANTAKLLEAQVSLLGRRGGRFLLRAIFDACSVEDGSGESADAAAIMNLVQRLVMAGVELQNDNCKEVKGSDLNKMTTTTKAWVQSLAPNANQSTVSWATWLDWATNTAPDIHRPLSTVFHLFLLGKDYSFRPEPLELPSFYTTTTTATNAATTTNGNKVPNDSSLWRHPYDSIPTSLAFMSLGGRWRRLYGSDQDGLSFPTFRQALLSYTGPTVILIETVAGDTLGYYSESPWKSCSSPSWYSSDGDSFLFRLHPAWNVYQRNGESSKYMHYLPTPVASYRSQGSLSGLAVGGVGVDTPRFHLNPSLEGCQASSVDTVYESGPLLTDDQMFFDVQVLEVFAVKVTDQDYRHGVEAGQLQASIKEETRQQMAQVDRAQFVDDFKSGAFMNSLYQHRSETRGRHDYCASDEEGKGYFVGDKPPSTRNVHREDRLD